ncbi:hypothetical protein RUND412_005011 [Rhizina undulata]
MTCLDRFFKRTGHVLVIPILDVSAATSQVIYLPHGYGVVYPPLEFATTRSSAAGVANVPFLDLLPRLFPGGAIRCATYAEGGFCYHVGFWMQEKLSGFVASQP